MEASSYSSGRLPALGTQNRLGRPNDIFITLIFTDLISEVRHWKGPRVPMSRNCTSDVISALKTNPREFSFIVRSRLAARFRLASGRIDDMRNSRTASSSGIPSSLSGN